MLKYEQRPCLCIYIFIHLTIHNSARSLLILHSYTWSFFTGYVYGSFGAGREKRQLYGKDFFLEAELIRT